VSSPAAAGEVQSGIGVLHVINQLWGAGAESSLRAFILGSGGGNVQHAVAVLTPQGNHPGPLREAGVPVYVPARHGNRWDNVRHVRAAVLDFRPNLLHTSLFEADLAGRIAAWQTGTPVITSFVNAAYGPEAAAAEVAHPWKVRAARGIDRFLAQHATTAFHAISAAAAAHATQHLGVATERIRVVPRGRSRDQLGRRTQERRDRVRRDQGWSDALVIINVARQEPQKGHVHLIDAFAQVHQEVPEALLVLVGRAGRATPAIDECIIHHDLDTAVVRLGARDDVPDLLVGADLFAFPSMYEGLGGAVLEAAALEVPVVCSDLPALHEVLGPHHPWYVPPADPGALADTLLEPLRDPAQAASVTDLALSRFEEAFELQRAVEGMLELYRDACATLSKLRSTAWPRVPRIDTWS
jgi:glycosyltransferase involved in cell wall biosynthesis